jgi:hypothetical protein
MAKRRNEQDGATAPARPRSDRGDDERDLEIGGQDMRDLEFDISTPGIETVSGIAGVVQQCTARAISGLNGILEGPEVGSAILDLTAEVLKAQQLQLSEVERSAKYGVQSKASRLTLNAIRSGMKRVATVYQTQQEDTIKLQSLTESRKTLEAKGESLSQQDKEQLERNSTEMQTLKAKIAEATNKVDEELAKIFPGMNPGAINKIHLKLDTVIKTAVEHPTLSSKIKSAIAEMTRDLQLHLDTTGASLAYGAKTTWANIKLGAQTGLSATETAAKVAGAAVQSAAKQTGAAVVFGGTTAKAVTKATGKAVGQSLITIKDMVFALAQYALAVPLGIIWGLGKAASILKDAGHAKSSGESKILNALKSGFKELVNGATEDLKRSVEDLKNTATHAFSQAGTEISKAATSFNTSVSSARTTSQTSTKAARDAHTEAVGKYRDREEEGTGYRGTAEASKAAAERTRAEAVGAAETARSEKASKTKQDSMLSRIGDICSQLAYTAAARPHGSLSTAKAVDALANRKSPLAHSTVRTQAASGIGRV